MTDLPIITEEYLRKVFNDLTKMDVSLDGDPLVFGPKRLNSKVALCREHLNRCQQIYLQLADDMHQLSRANRRAKLDFDIKFQDLMANDPDVRSNKNVRDREAVANTRLRDEREALSDIEMSISDLESVISVVKAKREDLKDIQGRIRDQVKLCQEEIGLGARWGSAPPPGTFISLDKGPRVDPRSIEALNEAVGGLDGESNISDLEKYLRDEIAINPDVPATSYFDEEEDEEEVVSLFVEDEEEEPATVVATVEPIEVSVLDTIQTSGVSAPADVHTSSEVDDFFSEMEKIDSKSAIVESNDIDIDDLLSSLGMP